MNMSRLHLGTITIFLACVVYGIHAAPLQQWKRDISKESADLIQQILAKEASSQIQKEPSVKENSRDYPTQKISTENAEIGSSSSSSDELNKSKLDDGEDMFTQQESSEVIGDSALQELWGDTGYENVDYSDGSYDSDDMSSAGSSIESMAGYWYNSDSLASWWKSIMDSSTSDETEEVIDYSIKSFLPPNNNIKEGTGDSASELTFYWSSMQEEVIDHAYENLLPVSSKEDIAEDENQEAQNPNNYGSIVSRPSSTKYNAQNDGQRFSSSSVGNFDATLLMYAIPIIIVVFLVYRIWTKPANNTIKVLKITSGDGDNSKWKGDYEGQLNAMEPMLKDEESDS